MKGLAPRQTQVLDFIEATIQMHGHPPTLRETAAALGFVSTNAVVEHLRALTRKGYIARDTGKSRAIRVLRPRWASAPVDAVTPAEPMRTSTGGVALYWQIRVSDPVDEATRAA